MNTIQRGLALALGLICCHALAADDLLEFSSPGFPPSQVDDQGRLVEDWGTVDVRLSGEGIVAGAAQVSAVQLEEVIPAVQVVSHLGAVEMRRTLYRAPIHPAGVDVLSVQVQELQGKPIDAVLALDTSGGAQLGQRTARIGGRTVLVLPREVDADQKLLDWGYSDEAVSLAGWARPARECDAAFRNIRAGMGGVPIVYRFSVPAHSSATVVLGLCESHWTAAGQRPMRCRVEGAPEQAIDPVAAWGPHQPGLLVFPAHDADGDGQLIVAVLPAAHAPDQNPILNVIWIFPGGHGPALDRVLAGELNDAARYYVDAGGRQDQSIYPPGKMEFSVHLAASETQEFTFLVACRGGAAPAPSKSTWNPVTLRRAARDVWRDWPAAPK